MNTHNKQSRHSASKIRSLRPSDGIPIRVQMPSYGYGFKHGRRCNRDEIAESESCSVGERIYAWKMRNHRRKTVSSSTPADHVQPVSNGDLSQQDFTDDVHVGPGIGGKQRRSVIVERLNTELRLLRLLLLFLLLPFHLDLRSLLGGTRSKVLEATATTR